MINHKGRNTAFLTDNRPPGGISMITGSCKERIKAKMPQLTETEKKIGSFVLENYETVLQCNVSELATHSGVSDASVVRFCRSIGYLRQTGS